MQIDVPEMTKIYERQQAELSLLEYKREQFQASVGVAQAELEALQSEYDRVQTLIKTKAVTQRIGDETKSRHESAKARLVVAEAEVKSAASSVMVGRKTLEETEVMLQYASLKAPFAGIVTQRSVDPGDLVRNKVSSDGSREPLFTVSKVDVLRVTVPIPERDAVWVKKGDIAEMSFTALPAPGPRESGSPLQWSFRPVHGAADSKQNACRSPGRYCSGLPHRPWHSRCP